MNIESERWPSVSLECKLAKQLGDRNLYAVRGCITAADRRERVRARILELGIAETVAGTRGGRELVWREMFEDIFGVPLMWARTQ